ncbi:MAG: hypothetical protein WC700_04175 [Gemmatimonadaceae bacterium]|jgi:hypothetical protein
MSQRLIGVRAPPSARARADLSKVNAGVLEHKLYVKIVAPNDPDVKSRELTLELLRYIESRKPLINRMGLAIKIMPIRSQDLQVAKLVEVMKKRGIMRLPALTTPNNTYLGVAEIRDVYERNIKEFESSMRRGEEAVVGADLSEDNLDDYFRDEMSFERAEEDAQETGLGEGGDMMDAHRRMMERREQAMGSRRPPTPGKGALPAPPPPRREAVGAPPRRADNVASVGAAPPRRAAPVDPYDAEIQETIDRLSRDLDDGLRSTAFSQGGGDSLEDEEGGASSAQDELMERAYYSNMSSSDAL